MPLSAVPKFSRFRTVAQAWKVQGVVYTVCTVVV